MVNWLNMEAMQMSRIMSEDVLAPELRNPRHSCMRPMRPIARLIRFFML